jgi:hypothetical protein
MADIQTKMYAWIHMAGKHLITDLSFDESFLITTLLIYYSINNSAM